ncbi:MAG: hypothetical protein HKN63_11230 [Rhodobacteraceae bacterium]|nr:hypothetical protein [Paracoccaceae bacterium]
MRLLGIRFCSVAKDKDAASLADAFARLGLEQGFGAGEHTFSGAVFPAVDSSWIEIWPSGEGMPEGMMLQLVVDDADAFASHARENGLSPVGPTDAHGERLYYLMMPGGLNLSFQSQL